MPDRGRTGGNAPFGLKASGVLEPSGPEIVLVTAGTASIEGADGAEPLELGPGEAAVVFAADGPYEVRPGPDSLVWRATAGDLAL